MSLTTLVDAELVRTERDRHLRPQVSLLTDSLLPKFQIPKHHREALIKDLIPVAAQTPSVPTPSSGALGALAKYIPTEVVALYTAACSAMAAATASPSTQRLTYWSFVAGTPVLFLLLLAGKRRRAQLSIFPPLKEFWSKWPWWKLIASTIAFAAWAVAIPSTPYWTDQAGRIVAAFAAVLVSTFLAVIGGIAEPEAS